ncbi:30S ribosomal protein S12 methylthiotransferase RimO [Fusibacter tunisiensis]|uniref:Ribosomal protein uS12 methylthiotransferase RimO n=1 Tax=Fusibacter tunisiensis TaxID=1008308 RepID=A0ABS2MMK9_9FIRM|nr:30S ribosomal protein S12 methylthiotransferase RimO [Fusibacter tunisiensis]MBM7560639.1 ribosomal protein S12 methylthiotransferase [Fusibacter tunisiensis]
MKTVYIETLGCSKNLVDSEQMLGLLDDTFELSETIEDATIVIVNTCSFIHDAREESIKAILDIASLKTLGKLKYLIVTGCLSQRYPEALIDEIPEVDAVVGTGNFFKISEVIDQLIKGTSQKIFLESVDLMIPEDLPRVLTTPGHYAYLKIAEGCDNFCTYCIIPKLRGKFRSRTIEDVVEEARDLASMGIKELILIAQDTSRYGIDLYDRPSLDKLLDALNSIEGIQWIRVHYAYPDILDDALLDGFFRNDKVISYFDIPIQHASNRILKLMNRATSKEDIETLIEKIRKRDPKAVIRTTVIVGFPGETESDFEELVSFAKKMKFDRLGAFTYSNEEDTAAYNLPNHVPQEIMDERRDILMSMQMVISEEVLYKRLGDVVEAVVEEVAEPSKIYVARSQFDSPDVDGVVYIHTDRDLEIGDFVSVKITDAMEYDLIGGLVE